MSTPLKEYKHKPCITYPFITPVYLLEDILTTYFVRKVLQNIQFLQ